MAKARASLAAEEAVYASAKVEKEYKKKHKDWPKLEDIPDGDQRLSSLTPFEIGLRDSRLKYEKARADATRAISLNTEGSNMEKAKAGINFALQEHTNRLTEISRAKGEKPSRIFTAISNTIGKIPPKQRLILMAVVGTAGALAVSGGAASVGLGLAFLSRRLLGGIAGATVGGAVGKLLFGRSAAKYEQGVAQTTASLSLDPKSLAAKLKELDTHIQDKVKRDKHARWMQVGAAAAAGAGTGAWLSFGGGDALLHQMDLNKLNPTNIDLSKLNPFGSSTASAATLNEAHAAFPPGVTDHDAYTASHPAPGPDSGKPSPLPAPEGGYHTDPHNIGGAEKEVTDAGGWSTDPSGKPPPLAEDLGPAKEPVVIVTDPPTDAGGWSTETHPAPTTPSDTVVLGDESTRLHMNDQQPSAAMAERDLARHIDDEAYLRGGGKDPFARFAEPGSPANPSGTGAATPSHWGEPNVHVDDSTLTVDPGNPLDHIPPGGIPPLEVVAGNNDWTLMRAGLSDPHSPYFKVFATLTHEQQNYALDALEKLAKADPEMVKQIMMGQHLDTHGHGMAFVDMVHPGDKINLNPLLGTRSSAVDDLFNRAYALHVPPTK